ncbi:MAG: hypothetical protein KDA79_05305, partial [Planctomycetaceae bacterium]|nr:hypothetical protein [Planctomycetaceae bacterium]
MRYCRYILLPAFLTVIPLLLLLPPQSRSAEAPSQAQPTGSRPTETSSRTAPEEPHRSPVSLAVSTDGRWALTANSTADTVSLVDLAAGCLVQELHCGRFPQDVLWTGPHSAAVSLRDDGTVQLLEFQKGQLRTDRTIRVGESPHGLAVLPATDSAEAASPETDRSLFVALAGDDEIVQISLNSGKITRRMQTGGIPRELCIAPNGRWLISCCNIPGPLVVHEIATGKELSCRNIFDDGFNLGQPVVLPDSSEVIIPSQINRAFPVNEANIEKGWVIDNRLSRFPLPAGEYWEQKQLNLDPRGAACGDLYAAALSDDSRWLVATAAGSHELLILDYQRAAWPVADPGDFISVELLDGDQLFRRVELGGRPLKLQFTGPETVLVANSFANSLQLVNVAEAKLLQTIDLGGPSALSAVRRGEIIFHDADRSFDSWFSCSTCHPGGHTAGQSFDTLNDGTYDTHKLTPTLHGVVHTSPWTWHGWQTSLR